tara:strand:- start:1870 stop:2508 length:639 start_codon:yes stop_codon:yes gene_type:complete
MDKKITVKKCGDYYFYKATNVFAESFRLALFESAQNYWFKDKRKSIYEEIFPPEATQQILVDLYEDPLWNKYLDHIRLHITKYCNIINIDSKSVNLHSAWMTRVGGIDFEGDHTKEELKNGLDLHSTFGNMHSHKKNNIGVVYYLSNPDPKYGTVTRLNKSKVYNNDGDENSLMIFDPRLEHSALYPKLEITEKYPRITVVLDCVPSSFYSR